MRRSWTGNVAATDLFWRVLVFWQLDHLTCHLVYRSNDGQHLVIRDVAVVVDVVQLEGPYSIELRILSDLQLARTTYT